MIFVDTAEFAEDREFRINDGHGGYTVMIIPVIWDQDAVRQMPLVKIHGIFMGDVKCYVAAKYFPRAPVAGEMIFSPANQPWEVMDCTLAEGMFELSLSATRSQPTQFGRS